jgi:hypothetical protein
MTGFDRQICSRKTAQSYTANSVDQAIFQTDYYNGLEPLKRWRDQGMT